MKNIPYYIVIGILAAASVSCGKESVSQVSTFPEDGVVRINAVVAGPVEVTGAQVTRGDAGKPTEYSGKDLGFFIDYNDNGPYSRPNIRWEKDPDKGWQPESQILWRNSRSKADIYAYAPYLDGETDSTKIGFSIPPDQLNGTAGADFLWFAHKQFDPNADLSGSKAIDITFNHALVKLTVCITKGNQFDGIAMIKKVCLNDTTGDVECNITNGKVSAASGSPMTDITMHSAGTVDEKDNFDAIFWPGDGQKSGATMVTVTMSDGKEYNLTLGQELTLLGGHAYTMTVRVGKDKLEVGTVTVADWNEIPVDINNGSEFEVD